ncbi:bidirectional sugar transporter SWEET2a isoform X2 [Jatropha curcas]|uniref:bidirectional sugar transporter SWEET2a isoform X2 n=1 Tax=Jatropha curcas TaxID=180498 RepID=UPI00189524AA|nr:bidirectional sugar transporter SWEET2a isoform X2 [Jatropha curcas]
MIPSGLSSAFSDWSDAAGIAGNILAFVLFVSPIPTFRRIIRSQSTEQFSGLPYIYSLLNCLICLWYGMPVVSPGIILVATVNSIGAVFQLIYLSIFIFYADKGRKMFVGYLSVFSLISMFASPLFVINLVIKTNSVEYMPFSLSLATFLMSLSFFAYGMLKFDPFIYVPNGIGTCLGILQLVLYSYYSCKYGEGSREPLLSSYA